ncbi:MAG: DUF4292 domain-containing protein [Bacteroidales bacterium]|nr:DUF4292 domain-containing protein [Bacteroidales bacterium]
MSNNIGNVKRHLLVIVSGLLLYACGPVRELVTPVSEAEKISAEQTLVSLKTDEADFVFFSTRFSGTANLDGSEYSVSGNIRIIRDSLVFISVAPVLGIEIARLLITPDTVRMVNRIDNTYYIGGVEMINRMLNTHLDFFMIQSLLVGNDFPHFTNAGFAVSRDDHRLLLHNRSRRPRNPHSRNLSFQQNIWLKENSFKIEENLLYDPASQRSLRATYDNFSSFEGQLIPQKLSLIFIEPGSRAGLDIRYSRTNINQPVSVHFSIPNHYVPLHF